MDLVIFWPFQSNGSLAAKISEDQKAWGCYGLATFLRCVTRVCLNAVGMSDLSSFALRLLNEWERNMIDIAVSPQTMLFHAIDQSASADIQEFRGLRLVPIKALQSP